MHLRSGKLRKAQGLADSTLERNRSSMDSIMSVLGRGIRLRSITTSNIDNYIERMELNGYSPMVLILIFEHSAHS